MNYDKISLRKYEKSRRKKLLDIEKRQLDKKICEKLLKSEAFEQAEIIFAFSPLEIEIDITSVLEASLREKKLALPKCYSKNKKMAFYLIKSLSELKISEYNILEPLEDKDNEIMPNENTLIIVPGLVFSKNGERVGFGAGYYDRYLADNKAKTISICYEKSLVDRIETNIYDIRIDEIITENNIYKIRRR
ncbi:MAG: 5-formyltetrahydrofolate cyclo-ligase [Candidatus Fimenecus sp.]